MKNQTIRKKKKLSLVSSRLTTASKLLESKNPCAETEAQIKSVPIDLSEVKKRIVSILKKGEEREKFITKRAKTEVKRAKCLSMWDCGEIICSHFISMRILYDK